MEPSIQQAMNECVSNIFPQCATEKEILGIRYNVTDKMKISINIVYNCVYIEKKCTGEISLSALIDLGEHTIIFRYTKGKMLETIGVFKQKIKENTSTAQIQKKTREAIRFIINITPVEFGKRG
jgi:hypothetical protein